MFLMDLKKNVLVRDVGILICFNKQTKSAVSFCIDSISKFLPDTFDVTKPQDLA